MQRSRLTIIYDKQLLEHWSLLMHHDVILSYSTFQTIVSVKSTYQKNDTIYLYKYKFHVLSLS